MNSTPPKRSFKDYFLPFLIIVSLGVCAVLAVRLWSLMNNPGDDTNFGMSGKAALSAISGEVEAYLPASQSWKIITEQSTLNPQESARTAVNGIAEITFDEGSKITLGNSSEIQIKDLENSLTTKTVALNLIRGAVWIQPSTLAESDFSLGNSLIQLTNPSGEIFLVVGGNETSASVITGELTATILDPKNTKDPELKNYVVKAGETISISERRVNLIRIGGDIDLIKKTSPDIISSPLYITMRGEPTADIATTETILTETNPTSATPTTTKTTSPVTTDKTTTTTNLPTDKVNSTSEEKPATTINTAKKLAAPVVITGGGNIKTSTSPVVISGSVSTDITKVEVAEGNRPAFILNKFIAGSGSWKYNAATAIGNLKEGTNTYTVVGYDQAGNKTPIAKFTIEYKPLKTTTTTIDTTVSDPIVPKTPTTPTTTVSTPISDGIPPVGSAAFAAPKISEPADGATITTAPIHIAGSVPAGTKQVSINGYVLGKFVPGSTSWYYNADPKYGNIKEGLNEYEIEAINENGDRSSATIKITYKPAVSTTITE